MGAWGTLLRWSTKLPSSERAATVGRKDGRHPQAHGRGRERARVAGQQARRGRAWRGAGTAPRPARSAAPTNVDCALDVAAVVVGVAHIHDQDPLMVWPAQPGSSNTAGEVSSRRRARQP